MIYLLYGQDSYRSREKLREIIAEYRKKSEGVLDLHRVDAEDDPDGAMAALRAAPSLFQQKRLAVIERAGLAGEVLWKKLKPVLKDLADNKNVIAVFWEPNESNKFLKFIEQIGAKSQEFRQMTPAEGKRWLAAFLKTRESSVSSALLDEIVLHFIGDTWRMTNEAMKAALGGELTIPAEDADRKIFALLDTFLLDSISALRALTEMQAAGMNEQYIFAAVVNHTRLLLQLTGRSEFPADEKIHPFVLQKARAKVRNLEPAVISRAYKRLFKEDVKIKTGIVDPYNSLVGSILIA
ncbi:MAG: hypothetical protein A3C12_02010 [Candidatus Sungbacteria bacterium RIFCSPHIGHO2_02_FULL_49_20]|uniref:DNA-directed DNA polymerase n=1 Tax=Candidatus Sungbacteria bacterium RIFCSPHIGHO2_02_FULL_49_20 TaxID=1802272 RepID=A0A1G2KPS0_9BACT|nr:MAG: hypothetical protein A3C12_02010 [Candidatus Sungbacteria bacterium RIFCSPHIGHO2_02_FULL_49_20]